MDFLINIMTEEFAREILAWKYEKPYDFYNNEHTEEAMKELLDGSYYAVMNNGSLYGFFCTGEAAKVPAGYKHGVYEEDYVDMGLGMNPKLTGKGNGYEYSSFILRQIEEHHKGVPVRLTVATFNQRAIHLYENLGFVKGKAFSTEFADFITMIKKDCL